MLESTVHQQMKPGTPTESRLILIHQDIQSAFHPILSQSPIIKFNRVISNNSMFPSNMGFFVSSAPAFANVSKRDQSPASVWSGIWSRFLLLA